MADTRTSAPWIQRRAAWRWIAIACGLTAVLCIVAWFAARDWGRASAEREIAELAKSGAPASLDQVPAPPARTGADWRKWIADVRAEKAPDEEVAVQTLGMLSSLGYTMVSSPVEIGPTDPFRGDSPCRVVLESVSGDSDAFWEHVNDSLADPLRARDEAECLAAAFERRARSSPELLELGLRAPRIAQADARELLDELLRSQKAQPDSVGVVASGVIEPLCDLARAQALRGRAPECVDTIDALFAAISVGGDLPWMREFDTWVTETSAVLDVASQCVSWLPPETDFSSWSTVLELTDPRAKCLAAIDGTRAMTLRLHTLATAGEQTGMRTLDDNIAGLGPLASIALDKDLADFLGLTRRTRELAALSPTEAAAREATLPRVDPPTFRMLADSLAPRWNGQRHPWAEPEARRRLLQLAIIACTRGADAAIAACEQARDPFDDAPMRARRDADGVLTLWSIGFDRRDDGAATRISGRSGSGDFVLRVLAR